MKEKLVFFDIDGTLLDEEKKLPASTKRAVKQLQEQGTRVAIATGRSPFMFTELRDELGIDSFVSFNGQYVVLENEVIYERSLDPNSLTHIQEYARSFGHPMVFMDHQTMKANMEDHPHIFESISSLKFNYPGYDPSYHQERSIYQALLFCTNETDLSYMKQYDQFSFIRWHRYSVDVIPTKGSKAEGIKQFIDRLGIDRQDVVAFGDALNDVDMLQFVGTGIAMGNAQEEVKQVADWVTKDVNENGIEYGLREIGLIKD